MDEENIFDNGIDFRWGLVKAFSFWALIEILQLLVYKDMCMHVWLFLYVN